MVALTRQLLLKNPDPNMCSPFQTTLQDAEIACQEIECEAGLAPDVTTLPKSLGGLAVGKGVPQRIIGLYSPFIVRAFRGANDAAGHAAPSALLVLETLLGAVCAGQDH